MITIVQAHNELRLEGSLAHLNLGAGDARLRIYSGSRPSLASDPATGTLLVEFALPKPTGTVSNNQLVIPGATALVIASGTAGWARFVNGNGDNSFDCDVGVGIGAWEVRMAQLQLYEGGDAQLVSATFS